MTQDQIQQVRQLLEESERYWEDILIRDERNQNDKRERK